jgi:hypothetical protein
VELGWPRAAVAVVDEDTGRSGERREARLAFRELVAGVGPGSRRPDPGRETSGRVARGSADWHRLLDMRALTDEH